MDHTAGVRVREGVEEALQDPLNLPPGQQAHLVREGVALDELHREVRRAGDELSVAGAGRLLRHRAVVDDHRDVRVVEARHRPDLVPERLDEHRP